MTPHPRAKRAAALVVALVVTVVVALTPAATAQRRSDDDPRAERDAGPPRVTLLSQSPFVEAGEDFELELRVEGARPTDRLKYVIWGAAERSELRAATDDEGRSGEEALLDAGLIRIFPRTEPTRFGELADADGRVTLTIPERAGTVNPGVYPITIHVVRDGTQSDALLTTTMVRVAEADPTAGPLDVALVLPLQATLAHHADGSVSLDANERRRLRALVELVERRRQLPITLRPSPETVDALAAGGPDDIALLDRIVALAATHTVLGGPYVPVDEEALRAAGLDLLVADLHNAGSNALLTNVGEPVMTIAQLDRTDNDQTLLLRRDLGAHHVLVDEGALEPLDEDDFPAVLLQAFVLEDSVGAEVRAFATDDVLTALADRLDDPALDADRPLLTQQFVADLVAGYADDPDLRRGTVVVLPDDWDPTVADADDLLATLNAVPTLRFTSLTTLLDTAEVAAPDGQRSPASRSRRGAASRPLVRSLAPEPPADLRTYAARFDQTSRRLRAFDAIAARGSVTTHAHTLQRISADERLRGDERRRYLDGADDLVAAQFDPDSGGGLVGPGSQRVTMTSRRATIPIQIENRLGFAANVRVEVRSEKLDFPEGWYREVTLTPGPNTIEIEVASKVSGDSLLEVTVLPPDGDTSLGPLTRGTFAVRSTALSGVGVVLSALAVAVLLIWWAKHLARSRRAKRRGASPSTDDPSTDDATVAVADAADAATDDEPRTDELAAAPSDPLTRTEP